MYIECTCSSQPDRIRILNIFILSKLYKYRIYSQPENWILAFKYLAFSDKYLNIWILKYIHVTLLREKGLKYYFKVQSLIRLNTFDLSLVIVKTPTPTQHNTTVGFDMKMTVQTTPPHPTPPPTQTFQPLLDQLETWNWAQTVTRPIWLR